MPRWFRYYVAGLLLWTVWSIVRVAQYHAIHPLERPLANVGPLKKAQEVR